MPAEFIPERGHYLRGKGRLISRNEPRKQRKSKNWRWNAFLDGFQHSPPAFAAILHVGRDTGEIPFFLKGKFCQFKQPGAHHTSLVPKMGKLEQIELIIGLLKYLKTFTVRLKHAVFDSVMHHLGEMPGAAESYVFHAIGRREGRQKRAYLVVCFLRTAHHHAIAVLQAPDSARSAGIEVMNPQGFQVSSPPLRVLEV